MKGEKVKKTAHNNHPLTSLLLTGCLLLLTPTTAGAQAMRQVWLSMPDTLLGYVNQSKRIEAMDYRDMGLKLDVKNLLAGSTLVDTLTADFMEVKTSEAATLQLKLLPTPDGADSVVCMVRTLLGPEAESEVRFFDRSWHPLPDSTAYPAVDMLTCRPDTMSQERFDACRHLLEPTMLAASLSIDEPTLQVGLTVPMLTTDEKRQVGAILRQRKLKWDGKKFK